MENQLENRRVRMTKKMLKDSLLELLEHKELSRITVTEICENADVHRSTFYKHYEDPPALLREIEQDYLDIIPHSDVMPDEKGKADLLCTRYIKDPDDPAAAQSRSAGIYMACGSIGLMWDWIASDFPCSSREIAEAIFHLSTKISS